jgi:hypothetical protein
MLSGTKSNGPETLDFSIILRSIKMLNKCLYNMLINSTMHRSLSAYIYVPEKIDGLIFFKFLEKKEIVFPPPLGYIIMVDASMHFAELIWRNINWT